MVCEEGVGGWSCIFTVSFTYSEAAKVKCVTRGADYCGENSFLLRLRSEPCSKARKSATSVGARPDGRDQCLQHRTGSIKETPELLLDPR